MALRPQHQFLRGFLLSLSFFFCLAIKFHWFLCGGEYGAGWIKTSKGCLDKPNARKKRTASLCRYQERVTSLGAGGWGQTHSSFPGAYLKAAYFFSNLHAGGFCRSLWALRPWCDPGGTDSQAPHLMTAALPPPTPPTIHCCLGLVPTDSLLRGAGLCSHLKLERQWKAIPTPPISPQLCLQGELQQPDGNSETPPPHRCVGATETQGTLAILEHKYINF